MGIRARAIRFQQKQENVALYSTVLAAGQILSQCCVDYFRQDNPRGYQRPLAQARLRQVSAYLRREEGMFPTSILLCVRQPDRVQFESQGPANGNGEWGELTVPAEVPLWVVDGQHRLFGLQRALTRDGLQWVKDYPLPVTIVEGVDDYGEMRYFHVINTRQKGVPADLVDRHLMSMREAEGLPFLEGVSEREYLRARAAKATEVLQASPESPWYGRIRLAGQARSAGHLLGQHVMVTALQDLLKDSFLKRLDDEEVGQLLVNYWCALRARWPTAFAEPERHVIQKPCGVRALHLLFPQVVDLCRESKDFSAEGMHQILLNMSITSRFWHREHGHPLTREAGPYYVRALVQYLRQELPRPALPRIEARSLASS